MAAISSSQDTNLEKVSFCRQRRSLQTDAHPARRAGAQGQASATYQMKQLRCDSIGWVRVSPSKGSGSLIVGFDVAHEFAAQVGHGCEDSAGNHVALDFGEPVFDLVEPGTISGGVMERHVWVVGQETI